MRPISASWRYRRTLDGGRCVCLRSHGLVRKQQEEKESAGSRPSNPSQGAGGPPILAGRAVAVLILQPTRSTMAGDIYQEIWDADQAHNGVRAIRDGDPAGDGGYVVVDEAASASTNHKLLPRVEIPAGKRASYDRVARLFNNFTLDQTKRENDFPAETEEVQAFLQAITTTPPMEVARDYAARQTARAIGPDEWRATVARVWFERSNLGGESKDLTGFEHSIVGEQKQGKVSGYHFWYKYYLDENFRAPNGGESDLIDFKAWKGGTENTPDVVTLSYVWRAFDYEANAYRHLIKPTGGFWVGPSVEGLMALGTVRFLRDVNAPRQAVINGHRYKLTVFPGGTPHTLRSFFPEYVAPAVDAPMEKMLASVETGALRGEAAASVIARAGLHFIDLETGEMTPVR